MTINLSVPQTMQELRPRITVVGVGGAGGNAVNNMINADLDGVDFLVANTDGQALAHSLAGRKIQLGTAITQGLGAGSKPDVGRAAAEESIEAVMGELADCNMVFITAGMGGGTGTGAAPVIARAARERGILTVGVVTKPFDFEGQRRMAQAEAGIEEMQAWVDTLIVIPNQNLFRLANERTTFADAFHIADTVLHQGVAGVTDLMIKPGQINLDFADIRAVMSEMGKAMMGTGEASGESRATQAAEAAINNPLLDDITMQGARAVLINVTGGLDMTLFEVDEAANRVRREVDSDAVIIFGSTFDEKLEGIMRVSIVATGIEASTAGIQPIPTRTHTSTPSTIIPAPKSGAETMTPAIVAAAATEPAADITTAPERAGETAGETAGESTAEPTMESTGDSAQADVASADVAPVAAIRSPREPIRDSTAIENDTAYVPAFVATKKTSRLAFLSEGKPAPRVPATANKAAAIFSDTPTAEQDSTTDSGTDSGNGADAHQMSLDEAIERERAAAALATGLGASNAVSKAESPTETDAAPESAPEMASETAPDTSADKVSLAAAETPMPAMVADSAAEVIPARRSGFVPPAPTPLPDAESVPETGNGRTSLINKISGLWSSKPQDDAVEERREPAVETIAPVDSTPSILDLPRADALNRAPEPVAAATLEKSADDLEIPAFLRRQAN